MRRRIFRLIRLPGGISGIGGPGSLGTIGWKARARGSNLTRTTGMKLPVVQRKAYLSALRGLISTLSRPGRVNSKDRVALCDGLKRGHRRVVSDGQVVPAAGGDLAPSLKNGRPLLWSYGSRRR
jgi:hypothetical protein